MIKRIKLTIEYLKDKDVPFFKKFLILGSLLYLVFPVDIVPDFIIGLGLVDDIAVLSFIWLALKSEMDEYGRRKVISDINKPKVLPFEKRKKDD